MRQGWIAALGAVLLVGPALATEWEPVRALFAARCVLCHSGEDAPLGLRLDSGAAALAGSENGPVILPGNSAASPLIGRLEGRIEPQMPLDGPPFLTQAEIASVAAWIDAGAVVPDGAAALPALDPADDGRLTFADIRPILQRHCIECHSDNGKMGPPPEGLRLTDLGLVLAGGDRLVLVPGNPEASELWRRVAGVAAPRMPFDGPPWLQQGQIDLIRDWIAAGAPDNAGVLAPVPVGASLRLRGRMTGPQEIDGAAFQITGQTRIDDRPDVGDEAELRATVATDGTLLATRLRDR